MRVSDRMTARNYMKYLHKSQAKYAETNQKIASGNRFTKLSDDVSAGSRVLRARMERYKAEKQRENTQEANAKLRITEDNFMSMSWVLTRVHEDKVVRALNDPAGVPGREVLAQDIRSMMAEFVQYANASYGNMFSMGGSNAFTGPFTVVNDKLHFNGVDMDTIFEEPLTKKLLTPAATPYIDPVSRKYVAYDPDGNRVLISPEYVSKDPVTGVHEIKPPSVTGDPDYTGYSLLHAKEVPMDKEMYYDVGLGILVTGPLENPSVIGETAFRISYSGPEVLGFGIDDNGISNNIYNVLQNVQKNIMDFDLPELEKWDTKLAGLMEGFRANLTDIGTKTNFLYSMIARLDNQIDSFTEKIYDLMGVDDAEEATHQMMNDYVLKAILQMGSRILPLSLMDFVR